MFEKVKEFYKEHENVILAIGGGAVLIGVTALGIKLNRDNPMKFNPKLWPDKIGVYREQLEEFGATFRDGYDIPFATKEVVLDFIEKRGETYQIDILDDLTSVVWISK